METYEVLANLPALYVVAGAMGFLLRFIVQAGRWLLRMTP